MKSEVTRSRPDASLLSATPGPSAFLALCAAAFLALTGYAMARTPVLPYYAEALGEAPSLAGLLVAASTITGVLFKAPAGALSDVLGRRNVLLLAMTAFALPPFLYLLVTSFWHLLALRFVHGLATALFGPVAAAAVADLFPARRGEALAWFTSAGNAGKLLGPALGGFVLHYGVGESPALFRSYHYDANYLVTGLFGALSLAVAARWLLPALRASGQRDAGAVGRAFARVGQGLREVGSDRRILATSGADAVAYLANGALELFLPLYGLAIGLNARDVGLLWSVQIVAALLSRPLLGRLSDRVGRRPLILSGLVFIALSLSAVPSVAAFPPLAILFGLYGLGQAVVDSSTTALVADLSQARHYGAAMGVQGTLYDVGHAMGPILAGLAIELLGYRGTFPLIGGLLLLVAVAFAGATRGVRTPAFAPPLPARSTPASPGSGPDGR